MNPFLLSYFLSKVKEFNLETLEGRAQAAAFAIPVNKINNSVIKEIYASEVSQNYVAWMLKLWMCPTSAYCKTESIMLIKQLTMSSQS